MAIWPEIMPEEVPAYERFTDVGQLSDEPADEGPELLSLGEFRITAYCPGRCCNGSKWAGVTSSGATPIQGVTVAIDPKVIPYGTEIIINGHTYIAQDSGGSIKGKRLDLFFDSHEVALMWGVQIHEVFMVAE
jgi:3D (Asp-Asp-Asp) domain-containing protein